MIALVLLFAQASEALVAEVVEMDAFSWVFMLVSMAAVTTLAVWCFARILRGKEHFDPDGTGPQSPPVAGRADKR
jgi:hypothetical protein